MVITSVGSAGICLGWTNGTASAVRMKDSKLQARDMVLNAWGYILRRNIILPQEEKCW